MTRDQSDAGDRGQDAEDEAELDRHAPRARSWRRSRAEEEVAQAPHAGGDEGDEGGPGHRHVEEEDAARLADEPVGERRIEEGAQITAAIHSQSSQARSLLHGFHTTGNSIKPAMVTDRIIEK